MFARLVREQQNMCSESEDDFQIRLQSHMADDRDMLFQNVETSTPNIKEGYLYNTPLSEDEKKRRQIIIRDKLAQGLLKLLSEQINIAEKHFTVFSICMSLVLSLHTHAPFVLTVSVHLTGHGGFV